MDKNIVLLSDKVIAPSARVGGHSHPTSLFFATQFMGFNLIQQCPQEETPVHMKNIETVRANQGVYTSQKIILNAMFA